MDHPLINSAYIFMLILCITLYNGQLLLVTFLGLKGPGREAPSSPAQSNKRPRKLKATDS